MRNYKAAVVQPLTTSDIDSNLEKIEGYILEAAEKGAKLISLPEVMNVIKSSKEDRHSESENGRTFSLLSRLAKENKVFIHGGSLIETKESDTKCYNTTFMFDDAGQLIAKYRKIHTFDIIDPSGKAYRESDRIDAGDQIVTVETKLGIFGFAICYDLRFPEIYRLMAKKGVEVIFNPANFTMLTGKSHWEPLLRARAIENSCYMVAAGQFGQNEQMLAYGNSLAVDPWGTVIARASDKEGVTLFEIDLDYLDQIRNKMQTIKNRREDVYILEEKLPDSLIE